ncbi:MAG: aminodeoxychorismate synthase component I [Paracoccaceae bacterium]|nr:aminodeoxychorismate synthase component I [Paracoccaceae bacterium]
MASGTLFTRPQEIIQADRPEDLPAAFDALERARHSGRWLAGFATYEFGYLMDARLRSLMPPKRAVPLLQFGVFDAPSAAASHIAAAQDLATGASLSPFTPDWDLARYRAAFDQAHAYIDAGDIYQVNLTFPLIAQVTGAPLGLYLALAARQPVAHGAFVDLGGPTLLSRSPELFFRIDNDGRIETRPMKGTSPRGHDVAEDDARRDWLATDPKNRAENLMIVDLLRNDLARIAELGSVRVPELFQVETFATVHQMTSRVEAQLRPGLSLLDLFMALFPCGSITGAPKIRAMEIIRALEPAPREAYCGAIGWIAPTGAMEFNVAIRTLLLPGDGTARLNVGGGVVHDSTAEAEYEEALWKTRFAVVPTTT